MDIGIIGKPNVGKSTMFSALTLANAEIANYPFTTVEPNIGVAYVRGKCPCQEFEVACTPNNSDCEGGVRLIPVKAIDVAGLVPDAWQGKGLGNKFLDDLRQASVLIHIIDASGGTLIDGTPCKVGQHDPMEDIAFLEKEIIYWIHSIIMKDWKKISRQSSLVGNKIETMLHDKLTGLAITEIQIIRALRAAGLEGTPDKWGDEDVLRLCAEIQKVGKPLIIAANKCDIAPEENIQKLRELKDRTIIMISAEYELALRRAAKSGLIEYVPGAPSFNVVDSEKLSAGQLAGLEKVSEFMDKFGSTGVQPCLETAVFGILDLIYVYPVEDENKLTDKEGRVLPDVHLLPKGSNAKDLAYKVHTDLGDKFIRAIDARTKRVIGHDHELKSCDVITIVAGR
ncbi:MAG: redox-regulated ATPase YchF [Thermoplasmata archaeon]|nr:redox-regulated ATPase YchF [Thermoplasmata archaeon]